MSSRNPRSTSTIDTLDSDNPSLVKRAIAQTPYVCTLNVSFRLPANCSFPEFTSQLAAAGFWIDGEMMPPTDVLTRIENKGRLRHLRLKTKISSSGRVTQLARDVEKNLLNSDLPDVEVYIWMGRGDFHFEEAGER